MSATICPTRPKPKIIVLSAAAPSSTCALTSRSTRRAAARPSAASNGVTVSPSAVTACQKLADSARITPAAAPAPSKISVVSDGLAIISPVSAATAGRDPLTHNKDEVTTALTTSTSASAASNAGQLRLNAARSRLIPTVIRNTPSAKPRNGAVTCSTSLR